MYCSRSSVDFILLFFLDHVSLGALGDSFYEYLIKSWIQSGKTDAQARKMYDDTIEVLQYYT